VVDDQWEVLRKIHERMGDTFEGARFEKCVKDLTLSDPSHGKRCIAYMPKFCRRLRDIGRLVIGDFVREDRADDCVEYVLGRVEEYRDEVAFLIDIWDSPSGQKKVLLGGKILTQLRRWNRTISEERFAFLSVGGRRPDPKPQLLQKHEVIEKKGRPIEKWWKKIRGHIDSEYFDSEDDWHNPSQIPLPLEGHEAFRGFIDELARRDPIFCVWDWVRETLESDSSELEKRYAYLCGKAYLHYAKDEVHHSPFTALRSLFYGLSLKFGFEVRERLTDQLQLLSEGDIDKPKCLYSYEVGNENYSELARRFVDWAEKLHGEEGGARLDQVSISRSDDFCCIEVHFTEPVPISIFDAGDEAKSEKYGEFVTESWKDVCECFGSRNQPEPDTPVSGKPKKTEHVSLIFPRYQREEA
jgi:hypothetical protein